MSVSHSKRILVLWFLTIVITMASVVYQRMTGPSYPVSGSVEVEDGIIEFKLLRTHNSTADAKMLLYVPDTSLSGEIRWRRYKSSDNWITEKLNRDKENLEISIPKQPAAGKVMYQISLIDSAGNKHNLTNEPIIIRFKGEVSPYVLFPHIILMFVSMLLAARSGLEAIVKGDNAYRFSIWTAGLLFAGGIILGPVIQKYAFNTFWAGWPVGHDLTDNKTAIAMIFWIIAIWRARNQAKGRIWIIIAAAVQLLVYLIPHSVFGSELDYNQMNKMDS